MRTGQFSNDYHTAHISSVYYLHSYQSLAMPLKGRDTPADRHRNELEEEEEETLQTLQYSQDQVHHSGTAARPRPNGEVNDDCEFASVEEDGDEDGSILKQFLQDQLFIYPRSVTQRSWKRREGVVRRSWRSCAKSWIRHASRDRYTKYYKSHGAVCLFRSRRRHGVHGAPCDWGIKRYRLLSRNRHCNPGRGWRL